MKALSYCCVLYRHGDLGEKSLHDSADPSVLNGPNEGSQNEQFKDKHAIR